jgi:hypothetical protein
MSCAKVAHAARLPRIKSGDALQHEVVTVAISIQPHPAVPAQRASKAAPQVSKP